MADPKIAAIGDNFITSKVLARHVGEALDQPHEVAGRDLEWPEVPFHGANGPEGDEIKEYSGDADATIEMAAGATAILTHLAPIPARVFDAAPDLKFVGVTRGGPTNINMEAAKAHGVTVCNVPGRNASAVAEFTLGVVLSTLRKINEGDRDLAGGDWRGDLYRFDRTGDEMPDLTIGLVGYSHIGQRVVRLLKPFGCRILVCDPYATLTIADALDSVRQVDLDTLCRESDVVSLHARVTPETVGMISAERIASMPRGATLINTARGELIDEAAMIAALESGQLGGAALDTFADEPPAADNPLLSMKTVTKTPHIAGASRRVATFAASSVAEDLARFLRGATLRNPRT